MKFRGSYIKVTDLNRCINFWKAFLGTEPVQITRDYYEFVLENGRLGLLFNNGDDNYSPSNAVPMFSMTKDEAKEAFNKALSLGAKLVFYGIEEDALKCIVCTDPCGNEFELNALGAVS